MAARRSPLSPVEPGLPSTPCRRRESRPPRRRTCTSTTSTPITAVSSNGSTASTASPPRTCPIISVGGALSKPGATNSNRQAGSKALSETDHTNRKRYKSQQLFAEIRNPWYDYRHRPEEVWRWRGLLVAGGGCTQPETKRAGNFLGAGLDSKERLFKSDGYGSTPEPVADKSSGRACQGLVGGATARSAA